MTMLKWLEIMTLQTFLTNVVLMYYEIMPIKKKNKKKREHRGQASIF